MWYLCGMEEKKNLIPATIWMLDAGLAGFKASSEGEAFDTIELLMVRHGGKRLAREGNHLTYTFSNSLRHRYATVLVDKGVEDGTFTAAFREGNAPTSLMHYTLLLLSLIVMGVICWLMRSWWSLIPCLAVIALYIWMQYSPDWGFVRKVKKIREELGR